MYQLRNRGNKLVGNWLLFGLFFIIIQVLLGGITRLTQSGLSITDWKPILGSIPPLNAEDWQETFNRYKSIPQYEILNEGMSLKAFKWIYFWEFTHRLWGRLLFMVFLIPTIFFIVKNKISSSETYKYIVVLVLIILQGVMGWIMVQSGLQERIFVAPLKLMIHLFLAALLFVLVYRLALENLHPPRVRLYDRGIRKLLFILVILTMVQLCFGAFVAGSQAALAFPTWPKMGANWIPGGLMKITPIWKNFVENVAMVQVMHRFMAYILLIFTIYVIIKSGRFSANQSFHKGRLILLVTILIQVILGILTLINAKTHIPVVLGVLHQFAAFMFLLITINLHYSYKYR